MAADFPDVKVEGEIDRLYQLPLDVFVEARNALAARLKASGNKDGAARVKALARPNQSAWAANQVYWTARGEFDALVASVVRLQNAQLPGAVGGVALKDAMKERREATDAVMRCAASLLTGAGHGTNPSTLLRVSNTLVALAAQAARPSDLCLGRLVQDLEPPGFETFAAIAASPPPAARFAAEPTASGEPSRAAAETLAVSPKAQGAEAGERLRVALAEAEKGLDQARREAREAAGALSVAEKRAEAARAELHEATRRLERAQERAALTAEDETSARQRAEQAASARESAEAERDAALRALRALE
jgi:hypothetical protein